MTFYYAGHRHNNKHYALVWHLSVWPINVIYHGQDQHGQHILLAILQKGVYACLKCTFQTLESGRSDMW